MKRGSAVNPTVPQNSFWQAYATTVTLFREASYPQVFPRISRWHGFSWLAFPSLGKCLFIIGYAITMTAMLTANSIRKSSDPYYYESIGFRAAWMSVMQVPLIVLLAGRTNIVGFLIGSSYERLNWAHRWISRILLVSVALHAGFFLREWIRADFLSIELGFMPIVKYGMGAGGVLLWMNLSGLLPLRQAWYELYVIQHLASIAVFLWLLHVHVPSYAMFYIWMAIGFVAFDRVARLVLLAVRNVHLFTSSRGKGRLLGYETEVYPLPGHVTRVVIKNVPFKWAPGQHVYLSIPRLGPWESHPFTLSTAYPLDRTGPVDATLEIKAHTGFTHRLHNLAKKQSTKLDANTTKLLAFVQGPLGARPSWNTNDTVVLISGSTGASFTMPILESIVANPGCVRKLSMLMISRTAGEAACYLARLRKMVNAVSTGSGSQGAGLSVKICVCVTREFVDDEEDADSQHQIEDLDDEDDEITAAKNVNEEKRPEAEIEEVDEDEPLDPRAKDLGSRCLCGCDENGCGCVCGATTPPAASPRHSTDQSETKNSNGSQANSLTSASTDSITPENPRRSKSASRSDGKIALLTADRPDIGRTVRQSVETAWGETLVVVCGGKELSGKVRNTVASLSDERAVHKGSGAQGIGLWVEEFGL
jgi:NAD(P)H-flavin reductase